MTVQGSMDTVSYAAFRNEVHDFASKQCPPELRQAVLRLKKLGRQEMCSWQKILHARGWGAPNWPEEYGGTGWNAMQRHIFDETLAELDCPTQPYQSLRHIAPVLIEFGTAAQKQRYLPGILSGDAYWCQGYSEPGAGSDLASLKTRAELQGFHYVVNGQKAWTTGAHEADMMYALVRTAKGARKQDGVSMLLIDMNTPGITVRPVQIIDGAHKVNDVFFDNVHVPADNIVGAEGDGWQYGKFLLRHERLGGANTAPLRRQLVHTRQMVADEFAGSNVGTRRTGLERRLLQVEAEILGVRELGRRAVEDVVRNRPSNNTASVIKEASSRIQQTLDEIGLDAIGPRLASRFHTPGVVHEEDEEPGTEWLRQFLFGRARTIFGGSTEVQKNVLARSLFGH